MTALGDVRAGLQPLTAIELESAFTRSLPGDACADNEPRAVAGACYSQVAPTPVAAPRLLAWSDELGAMLGIARPAVTGPDVEALAGNRVTPDMVPYAARYGGHQFGRWAGQLGDGRAITLGEIVRGDARFELQLKGAGPTPYARTADGRAVLRSSLREFLCSEAMHHLGVPTTRALSLVATGETVLRDMFYDGNVRAEPGAIVCRVAPSFVRFGHFELAAALREYALMRQLADHVIHHHEPLLAADAQGDYAPETYAAWFETVCRRTALMIAHWMRVGFVHGVMNTDNMSVLGLTIDYGPYGWLEGYDPIWTPNTTDADTRRYCFGNQPQIAWWNLAQLANALLPLVRRREALERGLDAYREGFERHHAAMLADKLGLDALSGDEDRALVAGLFESLEQQEIDLTIFFRRLALVPVQADASPDARLNPLREAFYASDGAAQAHRSGLAAWLERYAARVRQDDRDAEVRKRTMDAANPKFVLRNYLAQQAIEAAEAGDLAPLERLQRVLQRPYDEQPADAALAVRRPEWARHKAGCSALSCSS